MLRVLALTPLVLMLAAGCNRSSSSTPQTTPAPQPQPGTAPITGQPVNLTPARSEAMRQRLIEAASVGAEFQTDQLYGLQWLDNETPPNVVAEAHGWSISTQDFAMVAPELEAGSYEVRIGLDGGKYGTFQQTIIAPLADPNDPQAFVTQIRDDAAAVLNAGRVVAMGLADMVLASEVEADVDAALAQLFDAAQAFDQLPAADQLAVARFLLVNDLAPLIANAIQLVAPQTLPDPLDPEQQLTDSQQRALAGRTLFVVGKFLAICGQATESTTEAGLVNGMATGLMAVGIAVTGDALDDPYQPTSLFVALDVGGSFQVQSGTPVAVFASSLVQSVTEAATMAQPVGHAIFTASIDDVQNEFASLSPLAQALITVRPMPIPTAPRSFQSVQLVLDGLSGTAANPQVTLSIQPQTGMLTATSSVTTPVSTTVTFTYNGGGAGQVSSDPMPLTILPQ